MAIRGILPLVVNHTVVAFHPSVIMDNRLALVTHILGVVEAFHIVVKEAFHIPQVIAEVAFHTPQVIVAFHIPFVEVAFHIPTIEVAFHIP